MGHCLGLGTNIIRGLEKSSRFSPNDLSPEIWVESGINSGNIINVDTGAVLTGYAITTKAEYTGITFTNGSKTLTVSGGVDTFFNDVYAFGYKTTGESVYLGAISEASGSGCNFAKEWDEETITDGILRCIKVSTLKNLGTSAGDFINATLNQMPYVATTGIKFDGGNTLNRTNFVSRISDVGLFGIFNFLDDNTNVIIAGDNGGTTTGFGVNASSKWLIRIDSNSGTITPTASTSTLYQAIVNDVSDGGNEQQFYINGLSKTGETTVASSNWNIGQLGGMNGTLRLTGLINVLIVVDDGFSQADMNNLDTYYKNKY